MDRTTRLGKPGKPPPEFAFHPWRRLEPLRRCNDSTIHDSRIQRFTRFRSHGCSADGPELKRQDETDLISGAVAPGTIQVPPSGEPILLLGDCQTIGGYPKIAHVITVDLGIAAQLRAGDRVRFSEVSLQDAHRLLMERERDLERFRIGLSLQRS